MKFVNSYMFISVIMIAFGIFITVKGKQDVNRVKKEEQNYVGKKSFLIIGTFCTIAGIILLLMNVISLGYLQGFFKF